MVQLQRLTMPVSGNYGTPTNPYGDLYSSYWEFQWYTGSDPAHTEGDWWGRSDLDSGAKIATLRFDNGSSVVNIPLYPESTDPESADIKKVSRIQTPNGEAWMPVLEGGGTYSYLGYQHAGARHGVHGKLFVGAPDSGVSRWTFDDTNADSWDSNPMTVNGATYTTTANVGSHALDYDGSNDYTQSQNNIPLSGNDPFTASIWIRPRTVSTLQSIFSWGQDNDAEAVICNLTDSAQIDFAFFGDSNHSGQTVSTDTWALITFAFDGTNRRGYINDTEVVNDSPGSQNIAMSPMFTGRRAPSSFLGSPFDGIMDDLRLYNKALSASEVSSLYNNGHIS